MKLLRTFLSLIFVLGLVTSQPFVALADEHGGKEHAGEEEPAGEMAMEDELAVLLEAAAALEVTHPELAAKLKALAAKGEEA